MDRIIGKRQHHEAVLDTRAKAGEPTPPGNNPGLPGKTDPDVAALVDSLAALVKGNIKEEVELVLGEAFTCEIGLNLRLEIGWEWTSESLKGAPAIQGSVRLANHNEVEAHLQDACSGDCRDPARSARVLVAIRKDPTAAFLEWSETWTIGSLPHSAHFAARCTECSATGKIRCLAVSLARRDLKLPRFDGHPTRFRERCCHAENPSPLFTGVPSPDRRSGALWSRSI